jgi:hypothetical protein
MEEARWIYRDTHNETLREDKMKFSGAYNLTPHDIESSPISRPIAHAPSPKPVTVQEKTVVVERDVVSGQVRLD